MKKRLLSIISLLLVAAFLLVGCNGQTQTPSYEDAPPKDSAEDSDVADESETEEEPSPTSAKLNGVELSEYVIVYSGEELDYNKRAAEYIRSEIKEKTSIELTLIKDEQEPAAHEIVVGETDREISKSLDVKTKGTDFAILADDSHVALEAEYFVIAAAAYFFVETYVPDALFETEVPKEVSIHQPIKEEAKNFILLIGDGMGLYQTRLFDKMSMSGASDFSDGENEFYGYLLDSFGFVKTNSLSGTTDSAAGGTALATGYKTYNGYVAEDRNEKEIQSLTELASSLGKSTAVMSTEASTGATPAAFSAHAYSRNDTTEILADQKLLKEQCGTIIVQNMDYYLKTQMRQLDRQINDTLNKLGKNEEGFFLMYEEAYIDKHSHNNDMNKTFQALVRFDQAIGLFMEYAFYNPDTLVIITADHETGGLMPSASKGMKYTTGDHTPNYVPIFAYGEGAEYFDGIVIENVQIPMTIAKMWGVEDFGDPNSAFEPLF